jgi:hypothetical protein
LLDAFVYSNTYRAGIDEVILKNSKKGSILILMKKTFIAVLIICLLLLGLGGLLFVFSQRTTFFGRAYTPGGETNFSPKNSYLFASPLRASADGQEKIRLTVFLLDSSGRGVAGQTVFLGQNENLTVSAVQPTTDELGRAIFDISAQTAGEYLIEARVGNEILPQRVKISFY